MRREFLGEVRCLVFDAQVVAGLKGPHFQGRIWVEDKDYTIVRFNGQYFGDEGKIKGFGLRRAETQNAGTKPALSGSR